MSLVGFDVEGYALFRCSLCGREIGLRAEGDPVIKFIAQGNFFAAHSAQLGELDLALTVNVDVDVVPTEDSPTDDFVS